mmetsp:Transcript_4933/g.12320  ORF Transcript_4933/g.12320 Transcript_4933/m.12320 type:complete len:281 (-) Transcript_4933:4642-5484(-)
MLWSASLLSLAAELEEKSATSIAICASILRIGDSISRFGDAICSWRMSFWLRSSSSASSSSVVAPLASFFLRSGVDSSFLFSPAALARSCSAFFNIFRTSFDCLPTLPAAISASISLSSVSDFGFSTSAWSSEDDSSSSSSWSCFRFAIRPPASSAFFVHFPASRLVSAFCFDFAWFMRSCAFQSRASASSCSRFRSAIKAFISSFANNPSTLLCPPRACRNMDLFSTARDWRSYGILSTNRGHSFSSRLRRFRRLRVAFSTFFSNERNCGDGSNTRKRR